MKRKMESSKANAVAKKFKLPIKNTEESTATDGKRVELDEHTTQLLEEELQTIMIKVWQALPDSPPSAAERYVAERLRNDASDDIRNVLGLNVTKRLLNVYNPLFVKLKFSGKPEEHDLRRFQRAFNISEMEGYVGGRAASLARVHRIADFDRLCKGKEFRCGKSTISVYPRYRFQICPEKMTTGFIKKIKTAPKPTSGESSTDVEKDVADNKSNDEIVSQATTNTEKKQETVTSKPISKNEQTPKTNIEKKNESVNNKVSPQSNINKVSVVKKNIEVDSVKQNNIITPNKGTDPKPNVVKGTQNVGQTTSPSNASKPKPNQVTQTTAVKNVNVEKTSTPTSVSKPKSNVADQTVAPKKVTEGTPKSTEKTTASTDLNKPKQNQVHKVVATKTVTESIPKLVEKSNATTKQSAATKKLEPTTKSPVKSDGKPNPTKPKPNQVNKGVVANKQVIESKQTKLSIKNAETINSEIFVEEEDEDEEMDDEEILALISSGVVVDECSGSDKE